MIVTYLSPRSLPQSIPRVRLAATYCAGNPAAKPSEASPHAGYVHGEIPVKNEGHERGIAFQDG